MGDKNKFVGNISINPIKLILKPSVCQKLGFKSGTLQWFLCRADKRKDTVDLSGVGMPEGSIEIKEVQLENLKLSDYPMVFKFFISELKKKWDGMKNVKDLHSFYFRVDYSKNEASSQLFFISKNINEKYPEGIPSKSPQITSKF